MKTRQIQLFIFCTLLFYSCNSNDKKSLKEYADDFCKCALEAKENGENPNTKCVDIIKKAQNEHGEEDIVKNEFLKYLDDCEKNMNQTENSTSDSHGLDYSASSDRWPNHEKEAFMTNCIANMNEPGINAEEYCSCMLDKVLEEYPTPDKALKIDMEWMMQKAQECL